VRTLTYTNVRTVVVECPWCPDVTQESLDNHGICKRYTEEEKRLPEIRWYWVDRGFKQKYIDPGIYDLLVEMRKEGIGTIFSCDGHGRPGFSAYVSFYSIEDAAAGYFFLAKKFPYDDLWLETNRNHLYLTVMPSVRIPGYLFTGSPWAKKRRA